MRENAVEVMLFLRLVPVFPFFLVNLVAALFAVPIRVFLLTTPIGIAPAAFIYNSVGRQLGTMTSLDGLLSPGAVAALLALAALSLLPIAVRRWRTARAMRAAIGAQALTPRRCDVCVIGAATGSRCLAVSLKPTLKAGADVILPCPTFGAATRRTVGPLQRLPAR